MPNRLGQHFLINKSVLQRIASVVDPQPNETIIEIGPGHGELTDEIIHHKTWSMNHKTRLILIEKDERLAETLKEKYKNNQNIEIITGDVLKLLSKLNSSSVATPSSSLKANLTNELTSLTSYKVVGNIPYYLTGFLLRTLLELEFPPKEIIFTIQKEVAERIIAKPPHMNLLAVSVQYFGTPELLFTIPKSNFNPSPKIDSATIKITTHSKEPSNPKTNELFFTFVKAGFSHPRKFLISNLRTSSHLTIQASETSQKSTLENIFKHLNIPLTARAQELTLFQWKYLAKHAIMGVEFP